MHERHLDLNWNIALWWDEGGGGAVRPVPRVRRACAVCTARALCACAAVTVLVYVAPCLPPAQPLQLLVELERASAEGLALQLVHLLPPTERMAGRPIWNGTVEPDVKLLGL